MERDLTPAAEVEQALETSLEMAAHRRKSRALETRIDRLSVLLLGGGFVVATVGFAFAEGAPTWRTVLAVVLLGALHSAANRVEFVLRNGLGGMVPSEPVLVVGLFLLPHGYVPAMVCVGLLLSAVPLSRDGPHESARGLAVRMMSGWHCIGPTTVFIVAEVTSPDLSRWPVFLLALAAQFASDILVASARLLTLGLDPRRMVQPLRWTFTMDLMLAPLGLAAAAGADGKLPSVLFAAAIVGVIAFLARDRRESVESSVVLGAAVVSARGEARVDSMTGLANRRAWDEAVDAVGDEYFAAPDGKTMMIVLADLDYLKRTNDSFGHDVGDALIRALGEVFLSTAPAGATVARLGGDEFAMLLSGPADENDGEAMVARLRAATAALAPVHGVEVSASFGFGACPPESSIRNAFRAADRAVMLDKADRRSR